MDNPKRPKDTNQLAKSIVDQATGGKSEKPRPKKKVAKKNPDN